MVSVILIRVCLVAIEIFFATSHSEGGWSSVTPRQGEVRKINKITEKLDKRDNGNE